MTAVNNEWSSLLADYQNFNPVQSRNSSIELTSLWESRTKYSLIATVGSIALKAIFAGTLAQFFGVVAIGGTLLFVASVVKYKIAQRDLEQWQRITFAREIAFNILELVNRYETNIIQNETNSKDLRDNTRHALETIKKWSIEAIEACEKEPGFVDRKMFGDINVAELKGIAKGNIPRSFDLMIGNQDDKSSLYADSPWDSGLAKGVAELRSLEADFPTLDELQKVRNTEQGFDVIYAAAIAGAKRVIDLYSSKVPQPK